MAARVGPEFEILRPVTTCDECPKVTKSSFIIAAKTKESSASPKLRALLTETRLRGKATGAQATLFRSNFCPDRSRFVKSRQGARGRTSRWVDKHDFRSC